MLRGHFAFLWCAHKTGECVVTTRCDNQNGRSSLFSGRTLRMATSRRTLGAVILTFALAWCLGAQTLRTATAVAIVTNGSVVGITVTDGGSGYAATPTVTLIGGGGTNATATALVMGGIVNQISI